MEFQPHPSQLAAVCMAAQARIGQEIFEEMKIVAGLRGVSGKI